MWDEKEYDKIQESFKDLPKALPESIKTLLFPNGSRIDVGDKNDTQRILEWDMTDLKKYTENLGRSIGAQPLQYRRRRI